MKKKKKISFRGILKRKKKESPKKQKKEISLESTKETPKETKRPRKAKTIPLKKKEAGKKPGVSELKETGKKKAAKGLKPTPVMVQEIMIIREGKEYYGIPLDYVNEIKKDLSLTEAPQMPEFVSGVTEIRDLMIPVVDCAALFGLRERVKRRTPIIVVEISDQVIGLQVDEVVEIIEIKEEDILPLPEMFPPRLLIGAYHYGSNIVGILRMKGLLKGKYLQSLKDVEYEDGK